MFNRFFVSHLEGKGVLTSQQATDTLEAQRDAKIQIGTLAVEERLMTPEQAEIVNHQQATQNARFGELAISNGYLTQEQLDSLLAIQPRDHIILKQVLTEKKLSTADAFDASLAALKEELNLNNVDYERLLDNNVDTFISKVAGIDGKTQPILTVFTRMFITTVIRLVDKEIMIDKAVRTPNVSAPYTISLPLKGDASNALVFSAGGVYNAIEFAGKFAEGFMGMAIEATDEIARDALKEFMNCIGGLFTSELTSKTHLKLDIEVPQFHEVFPADGEVLVMPFSLTSGGFKVFIS